MDWIKFSLVNSQKRNKMIPQKLIPSEMAFNTWSVHPTIQGKPYKKHICVCLSTYLLGAVTNNWFAHKQTYKQD